jgi:Spy/CpxP family protein refolding chaperone
MRNLFYLILTVAVVFCSLSVFAGNDNNKGNTQNVGMETIVQSHIDRLNVDIKLTKEQEEKIIKLLKKLYTDRKNSVRKATKKEQIASKKRDYENYTAARDSILTEEQRMVLERKSEDRKNGINL